MGYRRKEYRKNLEKGTGEGKETKRVGTLVPLPNRTSLSLLNSAICSSSWLISSKMEGARAMESTSAWLRHSIIRSAERGLPPRPRATGVSQKAMLKKKRYNPAE